MRGWTRQAEQGTSSGGSSRSRKQPHHYKKVELSYCGCAGPEGGETGSGWGARPGAEAGSCGWDWRGSHGLLPASPLGTSHRCSPPRGQHDLFQSANLVVVSILLKILRLHSSQVEDGAPCFWPCPGLQETSRPLGLSCPPGALAFPRGLCTLHHTGPLHMLFWLTGT